jgi:hypothetical protein
MLDCVRNIRQVNEKTETCMKSRMNEIDVFHKKIEQIYHNQNVIYYNIDILRSMY